MRVRIPSVPLDYFSKLNYRVRLAPSPTGNLHIGTARTALFNWLFAKKNSGKFLLRIEDTDTTRSHKAFEDNILSGLRWLGLNWEEEIIRQSKNSNNHKQIIQNLLDSGYAYRCYTSEEELNDLRRFQIENNKPPRYDNRHRELSEQEENRLISEGRSSVVRLRINEDEDICWQDEIRGEMKWKGFDLGGDMVLSRRSYNKEIGNPLYNLAVVIDDHLMGITHVIRGEDHLANTAKQILLYKVLNFNIPKFAHSPLILNKEGKKLSKRDGVTSIEEFKEMGYLPEAINNYMTLLGWSKPEKMNEIFSKLEASEFFALRNINKSGSKFDWDKLNWINSQYIKQLSEEELFENLNHFWKQKEWLVPSIEWGLSLSNLLQDSLMVFKDSIELAKPFFEEPELDEEGLEILRKEENLMILESIYEFLAQRSKDIFVEEEAKRIINQTSEKFNVKKGKVMKSLRIALLGSLSGTDLTKTWILLSRNDLDIKRISITINKLH